MIVSAILVMLIYIFDDTIKDEKDIERNIKLKNIGTLPPNPAELITSENMKRLLNLLKSMYDIVLLDGTPCMVVSDSIALSSMVDRKSVV